MRANIARIMGVDAGRISLKGKTTEGMGFTGRKEGIESFAVCLLE
jgi:2-C-methyl-D-erythritol 2,4-cyclodiphosphate synthase